MRKKELFIIISIILFIACKEPKEREVVIKYYQESGSVKQILSFKEALLDGTYLFFYSNGQVKVIENYKEGHKNGLCYYFKEDGSLVLYSNYKMGSPTGFWKYFYPNGNLQGIDIYDSMANKIQTYHFDSNGIFLH